MSQAESSQQRRLARNLNELLQEIRVAQAGVQILFGFLLSIAFTERFARASTTVHAVHLITVLFAAAAVALLTAPAAWHRVLFRKGKREQLIHISDRLAIGGLTSLAVAMTGTVILLVMVVAGGELAVIGGAAAVIGFGLLWFILPLRLRNAGEGAEDDEEAEDDDRVWVEDA